MAELTGRYPVIDTLGGFSNSPWRNPLYRASFFRQSPANNAEVEAGIFGGIVDASLKAQEWAPVRLGWTPANLTEFQRQRASGVRAAMDPRYAPIAAAVDAGLVMLETIGDEVFVAPTETFVKDVIGRVKRYSLQE
jgi:hypothetical protein